MTDSRVTPSMFEDLDRYIVVTLNAWRADKLVKQNSYGVVLLAPDTIGGDFSIENRHLWSDSYPGAEHNGAWYVQNADGKNEISRVTERDSHEAVRLYQGLVAQIAGGFPYGGAIFDPVYWLTIGTSGFKEDEDILFSRTVHNRLVLLLDRAGDKTIGDARTRGDRSGDAGADRMTRPRRPHAVTVDDLIQPDPTSGGLRGPWAGLGA
jgi:hypothetical protein